jgi:hypothetical protein
MSGEMCGENRVEYKREEGIGYKTRQGHIEIECGS